MTATVATIYEILALFTLFVLLPNVAVTQSRACLRSLTRLVKVFVPNSFHPESNGLETQHKMIYRPEKKGKACH